MGFGADSLELPGLGFLSWGLGITGWGCETEALCNGFLHGVALGAESYDMGHCASSNVHTADDINPELPQGP